MNMISTGAFLPEMDASNKQETVAEKFARVWEKKNAKAARAGGVSLMALSLAACGSGSEEAVVPTDTTPFDQSDIDAAVDAALAEAALNNPTVTDFAVSAAGDRIEGTDGADTVTFTNAQFDLEDQLIDDSTGDGDVVNVTLTAAGAAASISGFEQINVTLDVLAGVAFNATNVTDATIDVSGTRLGYDGVAQVTAAGANNVTTSGNVTDLTVTDLSTGSVDASGLDSLTVDTSAYTATATARTTTVTVDGDIDLNATIDAAAATNDYTLDITATSAAVVTLDLTNATIGDDGSITINNTGDVTIAAATDELNSDDIGATAGAAVAINGGAVQITSDGAANTGALAVGSFDVTQIEVATTDSVTLSGAGGKTVVVSEEDATVVVQGAAATAATDLITVNVTDDQAAGSITAIANLATLNLDVAADSGTNRVDTIATVVVTADMNLTMAQDLTITTLTNNAAADTITVSGTGDLTITNATLMGNGGFDASNLNGGVTATELLNVAAGSFIGGSGDDTITTQTSTAALGTSFEADLGAGDDTVTGTSVTTATLIVTGGAGDDTVTADGLTTGTLIASMGAGDDTITLGAVNGGAATITIDGGDGDDTLDLGTVADLQGATVAITGIETVDIDNGATMDASDVTGQSWTLTGDGSATADLTIIDDSAAADLSLDLSSLTFNQTVATAAMGTNITITDAATVTLSDGIDALTLTGMAAVYDDADNSGTYNDGDTISGDFATITGYDQGTVTAGAITTAEDTGADFGAASSTDYTGTWNATTQIFTLDDDGTDSIVFDLGGDGAIGGVGAAADTAVVFLDTVGLIA